MNHYFKRFMKKVKDSSEKKPKSNKPKLFETFTKLWVSVILIIAIIDLQLSYILAFLGYEQIAETLSIAIVTEIIGVSIAYIVRAHLDTKAERKQDLEDAKFEASLNSPLCDDLDDPMPPRGNYGPADSSADVNEPPKGVG